MNRLNLICLGVVNMRETLCFYKELGFKAHEKETEPPIVYFDNQGSKIQLFPIDALARNLNVQSIARKEPPEFSGITLVCYTKSKEEVDHIFSLVKKVKGKIIKEPQEVFWGGYSGYFQDPNGYHWEVTYSDAWEFDNQEMVVIR